MKPYIIILSVALFLIFFFLMFGFALSMVSAPNTFAVYGGLLLLVVLVILCILFTKIIIKYVKK